MGSSPLEETIISGITAVFQLQSPMNIHFCTYIFYACYLSRYLHKVKLGISVDNQYFAFSILIF